MAGSGGIVQGGRPLDPTKHRTQSGEIVTADEVAGSVQVLADLLDVGDTVTAQKGSILVGDGTAYQEFLAGADGQIIVYDSSQPLGVRADVAPSGSGVALGVFGAASVGATTTTRYLWPAPGESGLAPTDIQLAQIRAPFSGTLRNLHLRHGDPAGNGNSIVYTVRINNVISSVSVVLASTSSNGSDLVDSVPVVQGDLIDIEITKALGVGSSPRAVYASFQID